MSSVSTPKMLNVCKVEEPIQKAKASRKVATFSPTVKRYAAEYSQSLSFVREPKMVTLGEERSEREGGTMGAFFLGIFFGALIAIAPWVSRIQRFFLKQKLD